MAQPTSNIAEDYIAGTGLSLTGALVDSWASAVNGYVATGTTTQRPTAGVDAFGPYVDFPLNSLCRLLTNGPAYNARAFSGWVVGHLLVGNGQTASAVLHINGYGGGAAIMRAFGSTAAAPRMYAVTAAGTNPIRMPMNLGIYGVISGASASVLHDAVGSTPGAAVNDDPTNTGGIEIGACNSGNYCAMRVRRITTYSAAQSVQDQADMKAFLAATYSVPTVARTKRIVFEGDSKTFGSLTTANAAFVNSVAFDATIGAQWDIFNVATSGATVATATARRAAVDGLIDTGYAQNVLCVDLARNDVGAADGPTVYANVKTELLARNANWTAIWSNLCIATSNATFQGRIDAFNALLLSSLKTDVPKVAKIKRFGQDPRFDTTADAINLTYYAETTPGSAVSDGTHPNNLGNSIEYNLSGPYFYTSGVTTSGASGTVTVTRAMGTFNGIESVILTASAGTITATAAGGTITNNGTGTVTVKPADGATSFTYVATDTATVTYTNGQDWGNPTATAYEVASTGYLGGDDAPPMSILRRR